MHHPRDNAQEWVLNCSNLRVGGAVSVAASVLSGLSEHDLSNVHVVCSRPVANQARALNLNERAFKSFHVRDRYGISALFKPLNFPNSRRLTLFGPDYSLPIRGLRQHVVGFAQPWIAFKHEAPWNLLGFWQRYIAKFKFFLQWQFFRRAHTLVCETSSVAERLHNLGAAKTLVVPNAVDTIFAKDSRNLTLVQVASTIHLIVPSRNYQHKNLAVLGLVGDELTKQGIDCTFFLTLDEKEWLRLPPLTRVYSINLGLLTLPALQQAYNSSDGLLQPTLLECFSAAPLEALAVGKPVFVSKIPPMEETVGRFAHFFDPLSPSSIASTIVKHFRGECLEHIDDFRAASVFVRRTYSSDRRVGAYLRLLKSPCSSA